MGSKTKVFFTILAVVGVSQGALAAINNTSSELMCRAKAKEVAADAYRGCVTEYKSAEIERLRRDYKQKLKALKDQYESEIDQLGVKTRSGKSSSANQAKISSNPAPQQQQTTITVKSGPVAPEVGDQSQMDLPEPIPVESAPSL